MIDGFNLALPRGTGVSTYGFNLALALQGMGYGVEGLYGLRAPFNRRLREIVFYEALGGEASTRAKRLRFDTLREMSLPLRPKLAREIPPPGKGEVLADQFAYRLPSFDRLFTSPDLFEIAHRHFRRFGLFTYVRVPDPPEIMHWTYPLPVRLIGAKNIYTLHDLVPMRLPYATLDNKRLYSKLVRACLAKGDHLCTVSEASRTDIINLLPARSDQVTNTYQAVRVPPALLEAGEDDIAQTLRSVFNLPHKGYFLFFGAIEPKKNVARLIEAYLALATKTPLVVVGARAWGSDEELRLLQRDEVQPLKATFRNIRRIDYLPRNLLMRLVKGAKAVAFPSLYEGFGLPALEAMMLGTPVLTSATSSLPEVAGKAALLVDPYDTGAITAALARLDQDAELRRWLGAEGVKQAAKYDMQSYQDQLQAMYDRVLQQ